MKAQILYLIIGLSFCLNGFSIRSPEVPDRALVKDGPYIYSVNNTFWVKWIENNVFKVKTITPNNFPAIKKKFKLLFDYNDLKNDVLPVSDYGQSYTMIDSIGLITDIHGEYNTYLKVLKAMGIIDRDLNWKFGRGHLVVLGDIFDRGDMVTEVFWHLFGLEKQAAKAGGMVHVLLGNHELMVLSKNLSYLSDKYKMVETISNTRYFDFYSDRTVLGKWLRSKPVMITINNIIFVHAGISMDMIQRNLTIDKINRKIFDDLTGKDSGLVYKDEDLAFLTDVKGPVWYRGYFRDLSFCESRLDSILDFYHKEHIIIGHTPNEGIVSLFDNKILDTDTGIMYHQPDEMLMYKNGDFYRVSMDGTRNKI